MEYISSQKMAEILEMEEKDFQAMIQEFSILHNQKTFENTLEMWKEIAITLSVKANCERK